MYASQSSQFALLETDINLIKETIAQLEARKAEKQSKVKFLEDILSQNNNNNKKQRKSNLQSPSKNNNV